MGWGTTIHSGPCTSHVINMFSNLNPIYRLQFGWAPVPTHMSSIQSIGKRCSSISNLAVLWSKGLENLKSENSVSSPNPTLDTLHAKVCVWYTSDSPISLCSKEKLCEWCSHGCCCMVCTQQSIDLAVLPSWMRKLRLIWRRTHRMLATWFPTPLNVGLDFVFRVSWNSQLFLFLSFGQNSKSIDMTMAMSFSYLVSLGSIW